MSKNAITLGVGLADNVSRDLGRITRNLRANSRNLASVGGELTNAITLPIVAAGAAMLKFAGDLDALKKGLAVTMGSASAAEVELTKLRKAAEAPGMGFEQAIHGSMILQGLGASADEARYVMLGLAKAVERSGGGAAQFEGLQTQFLQMLDRGKIMQEDIKFMKTNAAALGGIMQKVFGTSNPEDLRKMVTMKEFVAKLIPYLNELEGTGGSVKNSLENLWTSIRIGVGEIGLAILGVTGWGQGLDVLGKYIDKTTMRVAAWISENRALVITITKVLAGMAIAGPFVRFFANMGLLLSLTGTAIKMFLDLGRSIYGATEAMRGMTKQQALYASGWVVIAAVVGQAVNKLVEAKKATLEASMAQSAAKGESQFKDRVDSFFMGMQSGIFGQFGQSIDMFKLAFNGVKAPESAKTSSPFSGMRGRGASSPTAEDPLKKLWDWLNNAGGGDKDKAADDALKAAIQLQRDMQEQWPKDKLPSVSDISRDRGIGDAIGGIQPAKTAIGTMEVDILNQYKKALAGISTEQNLGADAAEILKMKVDAAAEAYREMASVYGAGSPESASLLDAWKQASAALDTYTEKQELALEKQAKAMEFIQMGVSGVVDAFEELFTGGEEGFKNFGKQILKLVGQMMKLLIVELLVAAVKSMIFGGAGSIKDAASLIPMIGGAIPGMAEGGVLTGESLIRAGEYPGVASNPEVIAPLDKLKTLLGGGGGRGGMVETVIRGRDLHQVLVMAEQDQARMGGTRITRF